MFLFGHRIKRYEYILKGRKGKLRNKHILNIFYDLLNTCIERSDYSLIVLFVSNLEKQAELNELNIPITEMKKEINKVTMQSVL